jgi:hypothetical protein
MAANIRAMTDSERRIGLLLQQDLFTKTGDLLAKTQIARLNDTTLSPTDRVYFERVRVAFAEYNLWLKR